MTTSIDRLSSTKTAAKRILRRLGIDVGLYRNTLGGARRDLLLSHIDLVIDVGAHAGEYGEMLRAAGYSGKIVSFEPITSHFERLSARTRTDHAWECRRCGVGSRSGVAVINVSGNDGFSSSILPMGKAHEDAVAESRYERTEEIEIVSLDDSQLDLSADRKGAYLKVDAQGYEREVLAGAEATLATCLAVELELSLSQLYEGQPLIGDMLDLMKQYGFIPTQIEPEFIDPHTGEILQVNCLFVSSRPKSSEPK